MTDSKVFMFPEGMGNNHALDPNLMMALNQNGGFGGNNWMWILFLFLLFPGFRNGGFGLNLANGNDLLMSAILGNGDAIRQLSSSLNCDIESVKNSINAVASSVQNVGNLVGMSSMQVINAILAGNTSLGLQIAQCCCENRLATCQLTNTLTNAIEATGRNVQNASDSGFKAVLSKLDNIQNLNLLDKIDALREEKTKLYTQIGLEHQNAYTANLIQSTVAPISQQLGNLSSEVASIKCQLPTTATVTYSPYKVVPNNYCYGGCYGDNNFWY